MTATEPGLVIESSRLSRLVEAVSLASIGEYATALIHIEGERDDAFGMLEGTLRVFIHELKVGYEARSRAAEALEQAQTNLERQLALIEAQRREIQVLSTPVLDVWEDVLAVPLVGAVDDARTREITEKLLQRVVAGGARWTILDLTGVETVDETTAGRLIGLAQAVRLVGGSCVLTGMSPTLARTLASLGQGLGDLVCLPNLRAGLQHCLHAGRGPRRP